MKTVARTNITEVKNMRGKEDTEDVILDNMVGGNVNVDGDKSKLVNFWGQAVSKKEVRAYEKCKKRGDVVGMRKVLEVPKGKTMPGFEYLGNGK
jgi:hypothetical protein